MQLRDLPVQRREIAVIGKHVVGPPQALGALQLRRHDFADLPGGQAAASHGAADLLRFMDLAASPTVVITHEAEVSAAQGIALLAVDGRPALGRAPG